MNKKLLVPELFNATQMLEDNPPVKEALKADKLNYIISLIYDPLDTNLEFDGYIKLNAQYLKNVINNYRAYLNYLMHHKIIVCDEVYIPGVRSKGYRFKSLNILTSKAKEVEVTDKTLLKKFTRLKEKVKKDNTKVKNKCPYLTKWFNKDLQVVLPDDVTDKRIINAANRINTQKYNFSVDDYGKRLHTDITRFSKHHRQYIQYKGSPMRNIDLKSSQPFLLIKLIIDELKKKNNSVYTTMIEAGGTDKLFQDSGMILYLKYTEGFKSLGKYIEDVTQKYMYSKVQKAYKKKYGHELGDKQVKEDLMPVFFGKKGYRSRVKTIFKALYPYVNDFLDRWRDSRNIPIVKKLQKLESNLIVRKIAKELPIDMPRFTIHDSVMVRKKDVEVVTQKILNVIKEEIGFYPRVTIE